MADRIIKSDSGNDVVIQNNGGTRKIEVTNSGDVEVTGDFKATTVKATNLKANDGTAGLVVADSTGEVTSSGGLKATNVKATNLKANDGTASLEIADSTGDIGFSGNTNLKIKLPSEGGIYESDGSTQVLTESGGSVTIQNSTFNGTIGSSATGTFNGSIGSSATDTATTSTSITSASVTNLDLNPCFSASYNVYDIYLAGCSPDQTTGTNLEMYFLKSDGSVSTAHIWMVFHDQYWNGSAQNDTVVTQDDTGKLTPMRDVDSDMSRGAFLRGTIFNPFSSTDNTSGHIEAGFRTEISGASSEFGARDTKFSQETLVSCTGLRFKWASGLWATGASNAVGKLIVKGVR